MAQILILDPFNRTLEHNESIEHYLTKCQADTVTISNVLNVINDNDSQLKLIQKSFDNLKMVDRVSPQSMKATDPE